MAGKKSSLSSVSLIFACGTALFSDGKQVQHTSDVNLIIVRRLFQQCHWFCQYNS
ncbi:hypothetical protein BDR04DRAFT_1093398 [Suillus decipiens]|nr:hypothetical protein BDR04DRAFT_1093398 [Suillus decipiens]